MSKKITTFSIDNKKVKSIKKIDKDGKEIWTKFKPIESKGIDSGMHFISGKPNQNHRDIYSDGKDMGLKDRKTKIRPAGICLHLGKDGAEYITLPPVEVSKEELEKDKNKGMKERAEEYIRRVKILNYYK